MADNVNHPSHYETGKFECIDVMLETQGYIATLGFCICNVFKYTYRHGGKNGREDIEKAGWYRNKYLELLDHVDEYIVDVNGVLKDLSKILPHADELMPMGKVLTQEEAEKFDDMLENACKDVDLTIPDDFAKKMRPPIELNPDEDGWYDGDHLPLMPCYDARFTMLIVPEEKVIETSNSTNGCSMIWQPGTKLFIGGKRGEHIRIIQTGGKAYYITRARITDIPETCEGGN